MGEEDRKKELLGMLDQIEKETVFLPKPGEYFFYSEDDKDMIRYATVYFCHSINESKPMVCDIRDMGRGHILCDGIWARFEEGKNFDDLEWFEFDSIGKNESPF